MVLRKWSPGLPLCKANLNRIPVWAKFHNVPMELWTEEGLSHIASAVGHPLYADAATEACSRVSFARICVEVEASSPLVDEFEVEILQVDVNSSLVTIRVSYQWRPPVCEACQVFGHTAPSCPNSTFESLVQPEEVSTQLEQVDLVEDGWHLIENRKKHPSSQRTSSLGTPISSGSLTQHCRTVAPI